MANNGNGFHGNNGNGFKPGQPSANPHGRPGKKLERDYLAVAKRAVTKAQWRAVVKRALEDALSKEVHPVAAAKARDFLLKALSVEQSIKVDLTHRQDPQQHEREREAAKKLLGDPEALGQILDALEKRVSAPPPASPGSNGNRAHS